MRAPKHPTREAWLKAAVGLLLPRLAARGLSLPEGLQVYVSFPPKARRRVGGVFLDRDFAADGKSRHVLVSPILGEDRVLDVLLHELLHAALPDEPAHGGAFKSHGEALGLEGPMRSSRPGKGLAAELARLRGALGPYPHKVLREPEGGRAVASKERTIVRFVSPKDPSYSCWVSPKNAAEHGPPMCPFGGGRMVEP